MITNSQTIRFSPDLRTIVQMATSRRKPLLAPGNEAEWAKINEEEERQEAEFAAKLSISERLEFGQKLAQQGVSFLAASIRAGNVPLRAFWS
jgi:hypothetical protein